MKKVELNITADCCSSPALISVEAALSKLLDPVLSVADTETIAVEDALGRMLTEDLCSTINVPGYDNSTS